MAPYTFLMLLLLSTLTTSMAQSNCNTSYIEFQSFKDVYYALFPHKLWDSTIKSENLCTSIFYIPNGTTDTFRGIKCDGRCHITTLAYTNQPLDGNISPSIGNLTFLTELNFEKNILSGQIPPEIGKLYNLQKLNLRWNRLSGSIPPQLGDLTNLTELRIESNNFNGSIPMELGKLKKLEYLDIGSCGLDGEIPKNLANLSSLIIWNAYSNDFTGLIPEILFTNMVQLKELRFYGNNFHGRLPSSLDNLRNLEILYMGEISINEGIPNSLKNLNSLKRLSLRNCQLTGVIPSYIWSSKNLTYLDLSFNNLTGNISIESGSTSQLETLLLQGNKLSGELLKLGNLNKLKRFDVSYNQLTGTIPTWLNETKFEMNLVWNFFDITKPNKRKLAPEFNCLDHKGKPNCTRSKTGKNIGFRINCGGKDIMIENRAYDNDTGDGNITFAKHTSGNWATSTTSYAESFTALQETASQKPLSDIYETSRASPGSLRYYGLNMKNGNYTVILHFAEIHLIIDDGQQDKSTGKRLFDIYIQKEKVTPNFNIMENASGAYTPVQLTYEAIVKNGVLDIHLQWAGKGTCCIPENDTYGPLISAVEVSRKDDASNSKSNFKEKAIISIPISVVILLVIGALSVWLWRKRQLVSSIENDEEFRSIRNKIKLYTYNDLREATNDFHPLNKLGEGGFGKVYKGILKDHTVVAIKTLELRSNVREFVNEVAAIYSVQHRNLVKLLGCCYEGDRRIIVLEFMEKNNLHQAFFGPPERRIHIDWPTRMNIFVGIARGIAYLHEKASPRIIHRDIKLSNILLDKNLNPKIGDFGLAKLFKEEQTHMETKVAGTVGYVAPEYAMRGQLTEKADVYSFGVLSLEILSGRNNIDHSLPPDKMYILDHIWNLLGKGSLLDFVDVSVRNECNEEEATRVIKLALFCTQNAVNQRPTMAQVVTVLSKPCEVDVSELRKEGFEDCIPTFASFSREKYNFESNNTLSTASMPSYTVSLARGR